MNTTTICANPTAFSCDWPGQRHVETCLYHALFLRAEARKHDLQNFKLELVDKRRRKPGNCTAHKVFALVAPATNIATAP